jgi:biopolymer transport protein ExbD
MFVRVFSILLTVMLATALCFGQATKAQVTAPQASYDVQLQELATNVQTQIQAIEAQIAAAQPQDREALQRQIADVKKQGEINRLEIMLQAARDKGDAARVTEIQQALENWRNPPQPQVQQVTKDPNSRPAEQTTSKPAGN